MEFFREVRTLKNRAVTITLPEDFQETEVEILILPAKREYKSMDDDESNMDDDIIEALHEVKKMKNGTLPKKTARELLSEL